MRGTGAVAGRVLHGLRGDKRTLALVFVAPAFLIWLFSEVLEVADPEMFDTSLAGPILLGFFVYFLTYILTAVSFLNERQTGTLERVLSTPISRSGLVMGYVVGFGVMAFLQSGVVLASGLVFLEVDFAHGIWLFFGLELLGALSALGLGVLVSLFAESEFQVLQFIPVVIAPQVILGGVFVPVDALPTFLELPARAMPLTYLLDGMNYAVLDLGTTTDLAIAIGVLGAYSLATIVIAALVVRRG